MDFASSNIWREIWNFMSFDKEMNNIVMDLHYYQYHLKHPLSVSLRNQKVDGKIPKVFFHFRLTNYAFVKK